MTASQASARSAGGAFAAAEAEVAPAPETAGHALQRLAADQRREALGERALGLVRKGLVEHRCHHHAEHAVAQELEALVAAGARVGAGMAERQRQQGRAREAVAQSPFQGSLRPGGVLLRLRRPLVRARRR